MLHPRPQPNTSEGLLLFLEYIQPVLAFRSLSAAVQAAVLLAAKAPFSSSMENVI